MFGQLVYTAGGRGRPAPGRLYGLPVLRVEADPTGFWGERRLRRSARGLRRGGALRAVKQKLEPLDDEDISLLIRNTDEI